MQRSCSCVGEGQKTVAEEGEKEGGRGVGGGEQERKGGVHYGPEQKITRINSHLIIHFPTSSEVSENASERSGASIG